jgi:pyruvate formate lyase activating enzyme
MVIHLFFIIHPVESPRLIPMTGTIFEIRRFTLHDGPGIRVTVFMKGCPLNCWWCHNPEGISPACEQIERIDKLDGQEFQTMDTIGRIIDTAELLREILKDQVFFNNSGGGVTFSGGEPLMQADFVSEILQECHQQEIHTSIDTSGFVSQASLEQVMDHTNLFLYDLKHMDDEAHTRYTGVSNKLILDNLTFLTSRGKEVIIRYPVIEEINDSMKNLDQMADFLVGLENPVKTINILPFHRTGNNKYKKFKFENKLEGKSNYPMEKAEAIKEYFVKKGFAVKIGG